MNACLKGSNYARAVFIAFSLAWLVQGQSAGAEQRVTAPAEKLCGLNRSEAPRVLIGPFSILGDIDRTTVAQVLPFSVAGALLKADDFGVWIWNGATKRLEGRQFNELGALLDQPILYSSTPDQEGDKQGHRLITRLSQLLQEQNCTHLFGGNIFAARGALTVSTYLLTTKENGALSVPFPPSTQSARESILKTADDLGTQLLRHLAKERERFGLIEIGCMRLMLDQGSESDAADFADAVQRNLLEALKSNGRLLQRVRGAQQATCGRAEATRSSPSVLALISAEISNSAGSWQVRPYIRLWNAEIGATDSLPITLLPVVASSSAALPSAARRLINQVSTFFSIVVSDDGTILPLSRLGQEVSRDELLRALDSVSLQPGSENNRARIAQAQVSAYNALSQSSDNRLAMLVLGRGFLARGEFALATDYLGRALGEASNNDASTSDLPGVGGSTQQARDSSELPSDLRGEALENLGESYQGAGLLDAATASFQRAAEWYEAHQLRTNRSRVVRAIAEVQLQRGKLADARNTLGSDTLAASDYEGLILRGKIEFFANKIADSQQWFKKALDQDPKDNRARLWLVQTYEVLGGRARADKKFADATQYYSEALRVQPSVRISYLAGTSAQNAGDYVAAVDYFYAALDNRVDAKTSDSKWLEGTWVNLVECLLLLRRFDEVALRGEQADAALQRPGLIDSRLLVTYLRLVARALDAGLDTPELIHGDPLYKLSRTLAEQKASLLNLDWSNSDLLKLLNETYPNKKGVIVESLPELFPRG